MKKKRKWWNENENERDDEGCVNKFSKRTETQKQTNY